MKIKFYLFIIWSIKKYEFLTCKPYREIDGLRIILFSFFLIINLIECRMWMKLCTYLEGKCNKKRKRRIKHIWLKSSFVWDEKRHTFAIKMKHENFSIIIIQGYASCTVWYLLKGGTYHLFVSSGTYWTHFAFVFPIKVKFFPWKPEM